MREIEFRGRSKLTNKWVYGNLLVKKRKLNVQELDKELFEYKYSIQYRNKSGKYTTCEVKEETIGQYVGTGNYGRIYEDMELYDEYADENCTMVYLEESGEFRLNYNGVCEAIEGFDGLIPIEEEQERC